MIPIYRIDDEGYYVIGNDAVMNVGDSAPDGYVSIAPPSGFIYPRFVNGAWQDVAPPPPPPTDAERIETLERQVASLTTRVSKIEKPIL